MGVTRRQVVAAAAVVAAGAVLAGCAAPVTMEAAYRALPPAPPGSPRDISLSISPASGAAGLSPATPVTVKLPHGELGAVTLLGPDGQAVAGALSADKTTWQNTATLLYNRTYTLKVTGQGADGKHYDQSGTFTTVKPRNLTMPKFVANEGMNLDGGTFGVGQPIVLKFDEKIPDRAAAERALTVTTSTNVEGGWYWMSDYEVHWRPKEYWPAHTTVTVTADVYGKNLGNGLYGEASRSAKFTIGQSKIMIADSQTHHMKVYIDGQQLTTINGKDVTDGVPISMGKGGTERQPSGTVVDFTTNSGPHVITMKYETVRMTSASFGITDPHSPNFYDEIIKKDLRITADGEFVHLRDWSTWQIGQMNTSHGCINVGVDFIYWIYDNFGAGDIVDVVGTNRHLDVRNGLGDWVLSWEDWQKGSALSS
jgi:lipoprotein-anchoring transpeptidase ErfK/SrfK